MRWAGPCRQDAVRSAAQSCAARVPVDAQARPESTEQAVVQLVPPGLKALWSRPEADLPERSPLAASLVERRQRAEQKAEIQPSWDLPVSRASPVWRVAARLVSMSLELQVSQSAELQALLPEPAEARLAAAELAVGQEQSLVAAFQ